MLDETQLLANVSAEQGKSVIAELGVEDWPEDKLLELEVIAAETIGSMVTHRIKSMLNWRQSWKFDMLIANHDETRITRYLTEIGLNLEHIVFEEREKYRERLLERFKARDAWWGGHR